MKTGTILTKNLRVLLVDDHPRNRNSIAKLLGAHNIKVIGEASDGLEAAEKARQLNPDIILMDIKMPRCNGLEATRLIKTEMPQTKIIILTASGDEYIFAAMESGADGFLTKLCSSEELVTLMFAVAKGECICLGGDLGQHQIQSNKAER